jgi:hypothetical protein
MQNRNLRRDFARFGLVVPHNSASNQKAFYERNYRRYQRPHEEGIENDRETGRKRLPERGAGAPPG